MIMAFIMLFTWQVTTDDRYKAPFQKSVEAVYATSELKTTVDVANDKLKAKYPVPAAVLPLGYAIGIKRQATYTSAKISLLPGAATTYNYDQRAKAGSISMTWGF